MRVTGSTRSGRSVRWLGCAGWCVALVLAVVAQLVAAQGNVAVAAVTPGSLDQEFGVGGVALSRFGAPGEIAGTYLGIAPDGSVVLGAGVSGRIVRLLPDGLARPGFRDRR